jgi:hypothetical protein
MNYDFIEKYNDLRETCTSIAKLYPRVLDEYSWLQYAIQETDITLELEHDGIVCYGYAYTTQTMCNEPFRFTIPFETIEEFKKNG